MIERPNLDHYDDLERGGQPGPEQVKPSVTETQARCLWPLWPLPMVQGSREGRIPTPPRAGDRWLGR
jgi:hypothetical protein